MKLTLLQIVQDLLTAIDAENVNSVGDTPESGMCVNIANRAFEELATHRHWKHFRTYSRLSASTNLNDLILPTGTIAFDPYNLWYDSTNIAPINYMTPEKFLEFTVLRNTSESNIEEIDDIKVYNDRDPQWFTSDDDEILRFDAIPDNISGLDASLTRALIYKLPTSRLSADAEVFDLPYVMFSALELLCLSMALGELKGDTQGSASRKRDYKVAVGSLARNSRLIDVLDDRRKWIVARRSTAMRLTPVIPLP